MDVLVRLEDMVSDYTGPRASQITKDEVVRDLQNLVSELQLIKFYLTSAPDSRLVKAPPMVKIALETIMSHDDLIAVAALNDVPVLRVVEIINQAINAAMPQSTPQQKELWSQVFQYWKMKQEVPNWKLPEFAKLVLNILSLTVPGMSVFNAQNVQIMIDVIQGLSPLMAAAKNDTPVEFVIQMLSHTLPLLFIYISPTAAIPADLLEIRKWASEIIPLLEVFLMNA